HNRQVAKETEMVFAYAVGSRRGSYVMSLELKELFDRGA
ncbi:MAG: hypothetical protein JWP04_3790, partial [Belnapia sp.]|nr:hypothetical protein [Belnapia sp.]